jgi:hypothetical protein
VVRSFSIKASSPPGLAAIDLSRLRGMLVVVAGCLTIYVAMHFVLALALGEDATAIYPRQRPLGWPIYERTWSRIAAVDHLYRSGQLPADTRLGAYIGVSTTATGIQRHVLDTSATAADRWIVLSGAGLSFENIENVMHPVFFCSLKPSTVVFGVHPQMLVGERYFGDDPKLEPQGVVGRLRRAHPWRAAWSRALGTLGQHWAVRHDALMADYLRAHAYVFRLGVLYLAGATAEKLFAPATEPWDDEPLLLWNLDDVEHQLAKDQYEFWERQGHFDAAKYDPEGDQAQSLVRMIRAYRHLGAKVYVVIMPLRSTLRKRIPPNAKPCLLEVIERAFPEAPPEIIDLEQAIPDRYFADEAHLSKGGSNELSRLVAEQLQAPTER